MVPLAAALIVSLWARDVPLSRPPRTVVAALVPLVPEGLVLLTSLTFAVAAVRLARLGTLAQRLNAVESLASVDTLCLDKTGTLTENRLRVIGVEPAAGRGEDDLRERPRGAVGERRRAERHDAGDRGVGARAGAAAWSPRCPFSSARKWSGVTLEGRGTLLLGAPDVLARAGVPVDEALRARVADARRRRACGSCSWPAPPAPLDGDDRLPAGSAPLGLVLLAEAIRPDAADTLAYLTREGVATRVISGDDPADRRRRRAGDRRPGGRRGHRRAPTSRRTGRTLEEVVERTAVYGRVTPEQKRDLVRAMTRRGRYVAMTGDGVNDVLALKEARLGIAMGNGSQMAKGVADVVLLTNAFATVPRAVEEGRRILRNTHRVAKLFVAKTVYSAIVLATLGLAPIAYPFLPRHITVASTLTIGVPAFFLALAPSEGPVRREGFFASLLAFVVPAGIVSALTIDAAYLLARGPLDAGVTEGRTAAVLVTTGMGLAIVVEVERGLEGRRVRPWVWGMVAGFAAALVGGLHVPALRSFFAGGPRRRRVAAGRRLPRRRRPAPHRRAARARPDASRPGAPEGPLAPRDEPGVPPSGPPAGGTRRRAGRPLKGSSRGRWPRGSSRGSPPALRASADAQEHPPVHREADRLHEGCAEGEPRAPVGGVGAAVTAGQTAVPGAVRREREEPGDLAPGAPRGPRVLVGGGVCEEVAAGHGGDDVEGRRRGVQRHPVTLVQLPFGVHPVGVSHPAPDEVLEQLVAVEAPPVRPDLGDPRPHVRRRGRHLHRVGPPPARARDQVVSGMDGLRHPGGRAPPRATSAQERGERRGRHRGQPRHGLHHPRQRGGMRNDSGGHGITSEARGLLIEHLTGVRCRRPGPRPPRPRETRDPCAGGADGARAGAA